ncbi:hypothetical protein DFQ14_103101 [Halopolyspora algeriensis]|uniref:Uncharacterized protein n=1 Tax=Halopolyspora algeriensis TaxID=1500506 RepID=A0A368VY26_9ACTN|nr:hypothetical protein [Halopolyspora algeriensis]RCW45137.1 hypothetical protein DFQ14_103101 [Halopolyspora algeriensis]TQM53142.1 hypothetical protein FHU43_2523 [Halopolyspora algeriensis]
MSGKPIAAGAWRCEGHWQADNQMDIWQCLDEVVLDALREPGELDDEEGSGDGHDQT